MARNLKQSNLPDSQNLPKEKAKGLAAHGKSAGCEHSGTRTQPGDSSKTVACRAQIVAVTGGKGGVGKSSLAVNIAIALSRIGKPTCLIDGDTGLANANILMGLRPQLTLEHLLNGSASIDEILIDGPNGVSILPGASGVESCVDIYPDAQNLLIEGLRQLEQQHDWLIIDTAAGISSTGLHFVAAAQIAVVVITPEPTSLTDAFSLLKVLSRRGYSRTVEVIVNMVASSDQAKNVYQRFSKAVKKFVGIETHYLGSVWMDESMRFAVAKQKPVATLPEFDPSCRRFFRLADQLISAFESSRPPRTPMSDYWVHRIKSENQKRDLDSNEPAGRNHLDNQPPDFANEEVAELPEHDPTSAVETHPQALLDDPRQRRYRAAMATSELEQIIKAQPPLATEVALNLTITLLNQIDTDTLNERHVELLEQQTQSLRTLLDDNEGRTVVTPATPSIVTNQLITVSDATDPPRTMTAEIANESEQSPDVEDGVIVQPCINNTWLTHKFDRVRFGSQQQLTEKIQDLPASMSLDAFLAQL